MNYFRLKKQDGFSLVEVVFYIALFAFLSMAIITSLINMTRAFKETSIQVDLVKSSSIMDRISREIKQAHDIYSISTSDLELNTDDDEGNSIIVRFLLSGYNIEIYKDGNLIGNLNAPNIEVTNLTFDEITTTEGKAIKVYLSSRSTRDTQAREIDFYDTLVLRRYYGN